MPTRTVQNGHGVRAFCGVAADFIQVQAHGLGISVGQRQRCADATVPLGALLRSRAYGAKQVGRLAPLAAQRGGPAAPAANGYAVSAS